MTSAQFRNREEDQKRVAALELMIEQKTDPDYDLPRDIFVVVDKPIVNDSHRKDILSRGWTVEYSEYSGMTTIKIPHAKFTDFVFVWTWICLVAFMFTVYHGASAFYYYNQTRNLVENI